MGDLKTIAQMSLKRFIKTLFRKKEEEPVKVQNLCVILDKKTTNIKEKNSYDNIIKTKEYNNIYKKNEIANLLEKKEFDGKFWNEITNRGCIDDIRYIDPLSIMIPGKDMSKPVSFETYFELNFGDESIYFKRINSYLSNNCVNIIFRSIDANIDSTFTFRNVIEGFIKTILAEGKTKKVQLFHNGNLIYKSKNDIPSLENIWLEFICPFYAVRLNA